jgi:hypothetical protein
LFLHSCCGSVVAAGKFKVANPDVPSFHFTTAKKPSYYFMGQKKHIKVKAF